MKLFVETIFKKLYINVEPFKKLWVGPIGEPKFDGFDYTLDNSMN